MADDYVAPVPTTHLLHFVGSKLYSPKAFSDEAKSLGVNRAFPSWLIRNAGLNYGDTVLLGDWKRDPAINPNAQTRLGTARIWGGFKVEAFNVSATPKLQVRFKELLDLLKPNENASIVTRKVKRMCGEYILNETRDTKIPLPEIIKAWEEAKKDTGEEGKMFLSGAYDELPSIVPVCKPVGFSRAGVFVGFLKTSVGSVARPSIGFIDGYAQTKYIKKKDRPLGSNPSAPSPSPPAPSITPVQPQAGEAQ